MQDGDLATSTRSRLVIVLEGVLATITPVIEERRFRGERITGWNILWHERPLKRMVYIDRTYPDMGLEVITFLNQDVADQAAEWMLAVPIPYAELRYQKFEQFTSLLPYQQGITQILDSDQDRLDRYGQLGRSVMMGGDI